jgi:RNA polymerase sigma-70 factor (ECF subfamily)
MDFGEIYGRYARDVYAFSLYLCGNRAVAEDITAETFARAFCGRPELRVDTLKAYLLAIARNLYRDVMERQRRLIPIGCVSESESPAPSPHRALEDRQSFSAVLDALQRLPGPAREALLLAMKDLRYEQIGAILGCSVACVKVRIHRARMQLKADLERQEKAHAKTDP